MKYEGKWMDCFEVGEYTGDKYRQWKGKIIFKTPCIEYILTKEQFRELQKKILDVKL